MNSLRASFSQFLEQPGKGAVVAVDVGFHHVLENVLHFIILHCCSDSLAVPFHKRSYL